MTDDITTVDKLAMIVGGSFVVLGTVVMGIVEALVGSPSPVPVTNDAGQVVAATTFPVEVRAALILLGFLVWFAAGVYKLIARDPQPAATTAPTGTVTE